jgi:GAF domain-containing protein
LASQEQESVLDLLPLSLNLLAEQEVAPRAKVFARFVSELIADAAVSVYTLATTGEKALWVPRATVGDAKLHNEEIPAESGLLGIVFTESSSINRTAAAIRREDYPHVDIRKSLLSLTYIPLIHNENLIGALEILAFEEEISSDAVEALLPAAEVAAAAIATAQAYEEERHGTLTSISRLTQLYDLEKVFSSTLEMDELLPLIGTKISEILECQAVNVWLMHPEESVELMDQAGEDPTAFK